MTARLVKDLLPIIHEIDAYKNNDHETVQGVFAQRSAELLPTEGKKRRINNAFEDVPSPISR